MKVIIAGGRGFMVSPLYTDAERIAAVQDAVDEWQTLHGARVTEVVSGGATGADHCGELWARKNGLPLTVMPADWRKHGKGAGPRRNREMACVAEGLIAFWNGESRGTADMLRVAREKRLLTLTMRGPT